MLQYLMGHESVETTMQYYVHWNAELAEKEVRRIDTMYTDDAAFEHEGS